jgi:tetratricopeptide (TPR) repeat protein
MLSRRRFEPVVALWLGLLAATSAAAGSYDYWETGTSVADWRHWDTIRLRDYNDLPFLEGIHRPRNQPEIYAEALVYTADSPPLTLAEFEALPASEQKQRRKAADGELARLRRFANGIANKVQYISSELQPDWGEIHNLRILPGLLRALRNAAGLDPSNPYTWHQLAYFHAAVGDRKRARESLDAAQAALDRIPESALPELRRGVALDAAWLARQDGWYDAALAWLERAEAVDRDQESDLLRGLCQVGLGDYEAAFEQAGRVRSVPIRKFPPNLRTARSHPELIDPRKWREVDSDFAERWIKSLAYFAQGETKLAVHALGEPDIADQYPYAEYFWNDAGLLMELTGDHARAALYYAEAMAYRPYLNYFIFEISRAGGTAKDNPGAGLPCYLGFGELYLAGSRFSYAYNLTLLAMHDLDPVLRARFRERAFAELTACERRGIRPLHARLLRADLLHLSGDYRAAAAVFTSVVDTLDRLERVVPLDLLKAAMSDLRSADVGAALAALDRAAQLAPANPLVARTRAVAYLRDGQAEAGRTELDRALVLDPDAWSAWFNRGWLSLRQGRLDAAQIDAVRAAELAPESPRSATLVAAVERTRTGDQNPRPRVIATAPYILEDDETMRVPLSPIARRRISEYRERQFSSEPVDPYAWLGEVEEDETALRKAFEEEPSDFNRLNLARHLIRTGRPEEGRALLLQTWSPDSPLATQSLLLEADRLLNDPERALDWADRLARGEQVPDDPYLWSLVAMICFDAARNEPGTVALEKAFELDPDNAGLQIYRALHGI